MTMDLTVQLRLADALSRPAAEATKNLERFAATTSKLVTRTTKLATALRGLASASRELRYANTATNAGEASTGRLRGTMSSIGVAGRAGAKGLSTFTRATEKLTASADKAATATSKLRGMIEASIGETFVDKTNAGLRDQVKLLENAARLSSRLSSGGGRGGRRGMSSASSGSHMPGVMTVFQPNLQALRGVYEQATSLQDAIIRMHGMGLSDAEIASVRNRADQVAKMNRSTSPLRVMNSIIEARSATGGNMAASIKLAPELANADQVFSRFLPKEQAATAHEQLYDMVRSGELRNEINDPVRLHKMFESMIASTVYSQGRTSPRDYHKNLIHGSGAAQGWSDSFTNDVLPFFMQELKTGPNGGKAGTGLQAVFRAVALGVRKKSSEVEWKRVGMMDSAGKILDENLAISDPNIFLSKVHKGMVGAGITKHEDQVQEYGKLFGTGTGQTMSMIGGFQQDRLESYLRTKQSVVDSQGLVDLANLTLSQSTDNLKASFQTLEGNVGSILTPTMTAFTDATTGAVRGLNGLMAALGKNGNDPTKASMSGTALSLLGSGGVLVTALLAMAVKRYPMLGRVLGAAGGVAATGGADIAGGVVAGNLAGEAASSALKSVPMATLGGLAKGGLAGLVLAGIEIVADRLIDRLKPALAPDKQKAFDAHQATWENAWIWQKPGLIWDDAMGKHETTETVAGQRAAGGPVRRGLTYLVGEKGPELFTPGLGGGISNNAVLGMMGGAGGDGSTIARSIRAMSFELASRISDMNLTLGRVGGGSGSGDYGSGGGGAVGGRRGFMDRLSGRGGHGGGDSPDAGNVTPDSASGGAPNKRLAAGRAKFFAELDKNPSLRRDVMKTISMENGKSAASSTSVLESMVNRAQMHGYGSLNQQIHDGFYGPVNRGGLKGGLSALSRKYGEQAIANVRAGSNQIGYRTDQGMLTDPGARKYMKQADKSGWQKHEGENFFWMGNAGRKWAKQQQDADKAVAQNPPALAAKARAESEHRKQLGEQRAASAASNGGMTVHVTNHIHPGPGHDEKKIAEHVHSAFNKAVRTQLSDGAFA